MSRPWKRARAFSSQQFYGLPDDFSRPRRPVLLYVDLQEVPHILEEELLRLPEAHQLTQNNLPNLSDEEELALLTYTNFYRYEGLDTSISILTKDVADQISRTWNTSIPRRELAFSIKNQMGNRQDLRNFDTLQDILCTHRPWWQTEQDYGTEPRVRFRGPNSRFIFRLTCHRVLPPGLAL